MTVDCRNFAKKLIINSVLYVRGFNNNGVIFSTRKTGAITGTVPTQYIEGIMTNTTTTTNTSNTNTSTSTTTNTANRTFVVGQEIQLKDGAKYTSGQSIPSWVINAKKLYVRSITNYGIVFSTLKTGAITGIVSPYYIK